MALFLFKYFAKHVLPPNPQPPRLSPHLVDIRKILTRVSIITVVITSTGIVITQQIAVTVWNHLVECSEGRG